MKPKKIPQRMCVGCQIMKTKKELLRIVRTPEGAVVLDTTGKKAGRGAYLCNSGECLAKAMKGKRLERALQHAVDPDVYEQLRAGIEKP
ncbi:MAG: YlxR family protein [Negativicutes bacterium]|nr:YlxR family protein [Negativicutes bacterium]